MDPVKRTAILLASGAAPVEAAEARGVEESADTLHF